MSFWTFIAAGGLSTIWLMVHLVLGGRDIVLPLLAASQLSPVVRDTQYLCWHFTSAAILCIAGFFFWAAFSASLAPAIAATMLAGAFTLTGIGLVALRGGSHLELPQGWLFLPITALGLVGILS